MNHRPKGLTQRDIAKLAGVTRKTVNKYENGGNVSVETENAILKACGKKKVVTDIDS